MGEFIKEWADAILERAEVEGVDIRSEEDLSDFVYDFVEDSSDGIIEDFLGRLYDELKKRRKKRR